MSEHQFTCVVCVERGAHFVRQYRHIDFLITHLLEYHDINPDAIRKTTTEGDETPEAP